MPAPLQRHRRLARWDYAKGASLFVTIAAEPRRRVFGTVATGRVELSKLGRRVAEALAAMPRLNPGLTLHGRVVMPDHVHFNVHLAPGLPAPLQTLGRAIRRFKNYTTKQAKFLLSGDGQTMFGQFGLWQRGYHDWLCLNRRTIDATERYIAYNPLKWELMHGEATHLRIHEPLSLPRLDRGDYWKGVGNVALLDAASPIVALRVSRQVEDVAPVVRRMESAADKGWTMLSGFISKGEQAVRDALCRRRGARLIRIRPSCIPNARFRPESVYVAAFAEGRCLEIGRGNDEVDFGRAACLDLNREATAIATAGEGLALYWKADGPHIVARHSLALSTPSSVDGQTAPAPGSVESQAAFGPGSVDGRAALGPGSVDGRAALDPGSVDGRTMFAPMKDGIEDELC